MKQVLGAFRRAPAPPATTSTVVAVLGMHRSGTSWLAGSLETLGLELGEVNTQAQHNAKGNRENDVVRKIHESVLRKNGCDWRRPKDELRWPRGARSDLARFITEMNGRHRIWGFKDPRTLLSLDEWHRQVPGLVRVGIYRHPLSVFRSLHRRHDDFTQDEAVALWRFYNERLLAEHARDPFPLLRFDVPPAALFEGLMRVADGLGLPSDGDPGDFFDEGLIHNADAAGADVPADAARTWAALEEAGGA